MVKVEYTEAQKRDLMRTEDFNSLIEKGVLPSSPQDRVDLMFGRIMAKVGNYEKYIETNLKKAIDNNSLFKDKINKERLKEYRGSKITKYISEQNKIAQNWDEILECVKNRIRTCLMNPGGVVGGDGLAHLAQRSTARGEAILTQEQYYFLVATTYAIAGQLLEKLGYEKASQGNYTEAGKWFTFAHLR